MPVPRILFVKTSSLGDVVHQCPAVSDVARCIPGAIIDWVVEEPFAEVVVLHPKVRRVIPVAIRRWRSELLSPSTWAGFSAFHAALRSERYDAIVDSQGLLKSALIAKLARGRRHGFNRASAREPVAARFYDRGHAVEGALHAVERNRQLAALALGYAIEGACDYGLRVAGDAPMPAGVAASSPYALLLTMTSRDDKLWPEEYWRSLGSALAVQGLHCVLPWGTEEERRRCARIASAIPGALVPRRMSITELARLASSAHGVVGVDTGLAHLAAALGAPVVGIYCGSDAALTGLYGAARVRNLGAAGRPPTVQEVLEVLNVLGSTPLLERVV